jgi:hypothetical protein
MKKVIFLLHVIFINIIVLYPQSPQAFKYQAIARDNSGNLMVNENIDVRISIITDDINGTIQYIEYHNVTTTQYGSFAIEIGRGSVETGNFADITWGSGDKFMKVEAKNSGETVYQELVTSQLLSVPYALYAENAVWNKNGNDINYLDGNVGIGTTNPGARLEIWAPTTGSYNTFLRGISNDGTKTIDFNIQNDGTANFGSDFTNFGIGTTSPTEKLEVLGTVKATAFTGGSINSDNLNVTGEIITEVINVGHLGGIKSGGAIKFYADTDANGDDDYIWYDNTNSEVFKISTDGNIGVGLSNPGGKLHVNGEIIIGGGGTTVGGCMIYDNSTSPGSIKYYDSVTSTWYILNESGVTYTGTLWNQNGSNLYYNSGNIGIGTISPGFNLHIIGSQTVPEIRLERDQGSGVDYVAKMTVGENNGAVFGTYMNHAVHLYTDNSPRLTISGDGNVGIGTTNPRYILDVQDKIGVGTASDPGNPQVSIFDAGDYAEIQSWNGDLEINPSGNDVSFVSSGGNVGIGTADPVEKLEVDGNVKISGKLDIDFATAYENAITIEDGTLIYWNAPDGGNDPGYIQHYEPAIDEAYMRISISDNPDDATDKLQIGAASENPDNFDSKAEIDAEGNAQFDGTLSVDGIGNSYIQGNVGIATTDPGTALSVNGFTQLGGNGSDIPKIKTKIITGNLDGNTSEDIATGLIEATFLDFEMIVDYGGYGYRRSGYNSDGADGFFEIRTINNSIHVSSKGSGILNQPYKLFIIYQEE